MEEKRWVVNVEKGETLITTLVGGEVATTEETETTYMEKKQVFVSEIFEEDDKKYINTPSIVFSLRRLNGDRSLIAVMVFGTIHHINFALVVREGEAEKTTMEAVNSCIKEILGKSSKQNHEDISDLFDNSKLRANLENKEDGEEYVLDFSKSYFHAKKGETLFFHWYKEEVKYDEKVLVTVDSKVSVKECITNFMNKKQSNTVGLEIIRNGQPISLVYTVEGTPVFVNEELLIGMEEVKQEDFEGEE